MVEDKTATAVGEEMTDKTIEQDDIKAILQALNITDCARPYSCHDVVHKDIIPEIRKLIGTISWAAGEFLDEGYEEKHYKLLKMVGKQ